jgi:signal transduction histidine kinase
MSGDLGRGDFREAVAAVGVGVVVYGADGRYRHVAEASADLLGTDGESLVSAALWDANPAVDADRFGETIDSALDWMEVLVGDLPTLGRRGVAVEDPDVVSLRGVATATWRSVDTSDAAVEVREEPLLEARESRLQQLFENRFRNALEHGSGGGPLSVVVGTIADGTGFYVDDDGPGIPESEHDAVFDAGETTRENGTGFELAILKGIAEAHSWSVSVTESADGGARFELAGVSFRESWATQSRSATVSAQ